jgi:hypothetical protein
MEKDGHNWRNILLEKLGTYPMYAFFLHTEDDKDLAEYLSKKGPQMDALTGKDCLIFAFEKPTNWDEGWKNKWKERLGPDFNKILVEWEQLTDFSRNTKIKTIADSLKVPINRMPCMVFVEDLHSRNTLQIPFIANKENYTKYFKDVFTCIQIAAQNPQGTRLKKLRREWRKCWINWIVPERAEKYAKSIQKWGSIISKTKDELITILDFVSPIIKRIF